MHVCARKIKCSWMHFGNEFWKCINAVRFLKKRHAARCVYKHKMQGILCVVIITFILVIFPVEHGHYPRTMHDGPKVQPLYQNQSSTVLLTILTIWYHISLYSPVKTHPDLEPFPISFHSLPPALQQSILLFRWTLSTEASSYHQLYLILYLLP